MKKKSARRLTLKRALEMIYWEAFYVGAFEAQDEERRHKDAEYARALEKVRIAFKLTKLPEYP